MANWEQRTEEAITGLRKLVQDLVAPEVSGIKAKLDAILDEQRRLREDFTAGQEKLRADLIDRIEQSKREIMLMLDNRFLREENERLKMRTEPPTQ